MPIYEYTVSETGERVEHVCSHKSRPDQIVVGGKVAMYTPSFDIAYTPAKWGESYGQAHYNVALGCHVESEAHRRRLMEQRGLMDARDVATHHEDVIDHVFSTKNEMKARLERCDAFDAGVRQTYGLPARGVDEKADIIVQSTPGYDEAWTGGVDEPLDEVPEGV